MQCPSCHSVVQGNPPFCPSCGSPLPREQPHDPLLGRTLAGKYRIVQLLGEGGMGAVYVGEQSLGTKVRKVAIKTLHAHLSRDESIRARFQRECETLATLQHPNTVQVFDFGTTDDGLLYIVMEFVQGQSIAQVLEREGPMRPERVQRVIEQIGGSLAEAHHLGIIHRDLKPDNIVLTERAGQKDFVKVLDFGIAKRSGEADRNEKKLTQQGMVLGTPPYMSPEQFTGEALDARSDVYSLGVMAYEMLTGQLPFDAKTAWEWATLHMTSAPKAIEATPNGAMLPEGMRMAVMRALAKSPEQRHATVTDLVERFTGRAPPDAADIARRMQTAAELASPVLGAPARTEPGYVPPARGDAPAPEARVKTQLGEPMAFPPGAFGAAAAPPFGGHGAPAAGPPAGAAMYGAPPPAYHAPAVEPARGHHARGGARGNKGLVLALLGVVAVLSIGAIAIGTGLIGGGGGETEVTPLDLGTSSGAPPATPTTTPPPQTATTAAPPLPTTTTAPPLTPGPATPPPAPKPTAAPKPTTPPPAPPPPAPSPTTTPPAPPPPAPTPTPPPPAPTPRPTPVPPPPPPAPTAQPGEPYCSQARAARAAGQSPLIVSSLERKCRSAGGTP